MSRLTFSTQVALSIILALLTGLLLSDLPASLLNSQRQTYTPEATRIPTEVVLLPTAPGLTPNPTQTVGPFQTIPGVWLVNVELFQSQAPQIDNVTRLDEGRISFGTDGESYLRLLDKNGQSLYELAFTPSFLIGDIPELEDHINAVFILPSLPDEAQVEIVTPQGRATYDLR